MKPVKHQFLMYALIGCINTGVHWLTTGGLYYGLHISQAASNLIGFVVAVICSFLLNAKFTFQSQASGWRFISFTAFMAFLSWSIGRIADYLQLPLLVTLVAFSVISLVLGFLFSKFIVFK